MSFLKSLFGRPAGPMQVPSDWMEYWSEECGFKVIMPFPNQGLVKHSKEEDLPDYGRTRWWSVGSHEGNDSYKVWCYKLDHDVDRSLSDKLLNEKTRRGAVLISREPYMGYSSVETFHEHTPGILYVWNKCIIAGDKIFHVNVGRGIGFNTIDLESDDLLEFKGSPPVRRKPDNNIKLFLASFEIL